MRIGTLSNLNAIGRDETFDREDLKNLAYWAQRAIDPSRFDVLALTGNLSKLRRRDRALDIIGAACWPKPVLYVPSFEESFQLNWLGVHTRANLVMSTNGYHVIDDIVFHLVATSGGATTNLAVDTRYNAIQATPPLVDYSDVIISSAPIPFVGLQLPKSAFTCQHLAANWREEFIPLPPTMWRPRLMICGELVPEFTTRVGGIRVVGSAPGVAFNHREPAEDWPVDVVKIRKRTRTREGL